MPEGKCPKCGREFRTRTRNGLSGAQRMHHCVPAGSEKAAAPPPATPPHEEAARECVHEWVLLSSTVKREQAAIADGWHAVCVKCGELIRWGGGERNDSR